MNDGIAGVVARLQQRMDELPRDLEHRRIFLGTYLRTTRAIGAAIARAQLFEDPGWVEDWDVKFAELYLDAHDADLARRSAGRGKGERGGDVARPWRLAFDAPADLPPLLHVLLGINAHVNYDLPQALLAVISDDDFTDPQLMERRRRDHERIDHVLASRVAAEDNELGGARSLLDRVLTPLNRLSSQRFLRESRQKVWHNTAELQRARLEGPTPYATRLAELELLSATKIADLLRPGQVLLRLAITGFGVTLPPPA
ncbi:DUF5995 family protein [Kribbella swartbergensis]